MTLVCTALTLAVYAISRKLYLRVGHPLLSPVFLTAAALIVVLKVAGLTFDSYQPASDIVSWPLGIATVALAVPVYKNRERLNSAALPITIGVTAGALITIAAVLALAAIGHLDSAAVHALAIKSVTAAVAIELAKLHGADPALTAAFTVSTGALGAMLGPLALNMSRVTDPVARGIALGTISHGQGTSAALAESELSGAMASLATAAAAVLTSLLAATYIPFLLELLRY